MILKSYLIKMIIDKDINILFLATNYNKTYILFEKKLVWNFKSS